MTKIDHRGHSLAYDAFGDRPRVVFQHGLAASRGQASGLLGGALPVPIACLDAPSHGESDNCPALHSFSAMADAVVALLDHLSVESAVLGGISMGAGIAINAAVRHPDRVDGLLLVRPAWFDRPDPPNLRLVSLLGEWIAAGGLDHARAELRGNDEFLSIRREAAAAADSLEAALARPGAGERGGVLADMVGDSPVSSRDELERVRCTTLVIATELDRLHPVQLAADLAGSIAGARLRQTPPRYTEPESHTAAVRELVGAFLAGVC